MNDWNDLIIRYLSGNASAEETERLNQWLAEDEKNLRYFFRYKNIEDTCHPAFLPSSIDTEQALRRICPQAIRRRYLVHWRNIAAVTVLLVTASILVFRRPSSDIPEPLAPAQALQQTPTAILVLPSGKKVVLGGQDNQTIYAQGVAMAQADNRSIHYTDTNSCTTEVVYHELQIPRGGKFSLTLSDGSRIWLNADTKVRYPLHFSSHERKIFIEGEAYLQVAPMKTSPFKVITPQCEISVLGTHFNVNAYPTESSNLITLKEGSVQVTSTTSGQQTTLVPGEQAVIGHHDGRLAKRCVDPDLFCSWHDGRLLFRNNSLLEILTRIARQYDVHIHWQNESLKKLTFSGELTCYERIEKLLEVIAETNDVKFTIKGKDVSIDIP